VVIYKNKTGIHAKRGTGTVSGSGVAIGKGTVNGSTKVAGKGTVNGNGKIRRH
jgi:hypothetical protein